jgi:glycosyltransferase involved in cell wall biosynthesis
VAEDRLEVITDWADETLFYPAAADPLLAARYGLDNRFNVIYGGNFGPAQNLSTLVHAAANLKDLEDLQIVFIGSGEQEALLRTLVEKMDLNNVRFLPRQPMNEIRKFFAMADALVVHLIPAPIYEMQIPSKIMAYLACGRPIICAIKGQAADLVLDAEAGLCCPPGDPGALADSIRSLHQLSPKRRQEYGERGRQKYLEKYTLKVQAKRFEGILRDVVN